MRPSRVDGNRPTCDKECPVAPTLARKPVGQLTAQTARSQNGQFPTPPLRTQDLPLSARPGQSKHARASQSAPKPGNFPPSKRLKTPNLGKSSRQRLFSAGDVVAITRPSPSGAGASGRGPRRAAPGRRPSIPRGLCGAPRNEGRAMSNAESPGQQPHARDAAHRVSHRPCPTPPVNIPTARPRPRWSRPWRRARLEAAGVWSRRGPASRHCPPAARHSSRRR